MRMFPTGLAVVAALMLATAPAAQAQTTAESAAAYTGPRFPGGPDSLRALTYRSAHLGHAAPMERFFSELALNSNGQADAIGMAFKSPSYKLDPAVALALQYLKANMQPWTSASKTQPESLAKIRLMVDFTMPLNAQPYPYADQAPSIPDPIALRKAQKKSRYPIELNYSLPGLKTYIQHQVLYPPAAYRQRLQGTVYAYFEITEKGAVEHATIVGSVGEALDVEVLKAIQQLPKATMPALVHDQPARVYYVLPITFIIQ